MEVNMAPCMSSGTTSRFGCPAALIGDVRRRRDGEEVTSFFLLDFDAHLLSVQQVEAVVYQETGSRGFISINNHFRLFSFKERT